MGLRLEGTATTAQPISNFSYDIDCDRPAKVRVCKTKDYLRKVDGLVSTRDVPSTFDEVRPVGQLLRREVAGQEAFQNRQHIVHGKRDERRFAIPAERGERGDSALDRQAIRDQLFERCDAGLGHGGVLPNETVQRTQFSSAIARDQKVFRLRDVPVWWTSFDEHRTFPVVLAALFVGHEVVKGEPPVV